MSIARSVRVMGILNVTPDSFSDGGSFFDQQTAVEQAQLLIEQGADIIDVGGESTRPYAEIVDTVDELARVIPVIEAIRAYCTTSEYPHVSISIDTSKAEVARQALAAGANIINDVSALRNDPEMFEVVQQSSAELIIMHMQGTPGTMQKSPYYDDVVKEVLEFFRQRLEVLSDAGIDPDRIIIDPGIGFGKNLSHNLQLIKNIEQLSELGHPVLLGHSRKRFLGDITGIEAAKRDGVSSVVSALCLDKQVSIFRVHDVAATKAALQVAMAIYQADQHD
ncbi:MAG: dihydropteroate synthase [Desulfocapsaceae bacterium]